MITTTTFTKQQLLIMEDYELTELHIRMVTELAIAWDEANRPKEHWHTAEAMQYMLEGLAAPDTIKQNLRELRYAGLLVTNDKYLKWKASLSPEGMAVAKRILDAKSKEKYTRVKRIKMSDGKKMLLYTDNVWNRTVAAMASHIIVMNPGEGTQRKTTNIYVNNAKLDEFQRSLHIYKEKQPLSIVDQLKAKKAPQMLIDKVGIFGEKNLPNWLRYDVEQFIGEKLAI